MFAIIWGVELPETGVLFSVVLWVIVLVYTLPVGYWLYLIMLYGLKNSEPGVSLVPCGLDEFQVRILTIDNEQVVQHTVDNLPKGFTDVVVIAEREIEIEGGECLGGSERLQLPGVRQGESP